MLDSAVCGVDFSLQSTDLVFRRLIRIVLGRASFSQFTHFFALLETYLLLVPYLLLDEIEVSLVAFVLQFRLFQLILQLATLCVPLVHLSASLGHLLQ